MNALLGALVALALYPGGLFALLVSPLLRMPSWPPIWKPRLSHLPALWGLAAVALAPAPSSPLPAGWQHLGWLAALVALIFTARRGWRAPRLLATMALGAVLMACTAMAVASSGWRAADLAVAGGVPAQPVKLLAAAGLLLATTALWADGRREEPVEEGLGWAAVLACLALLEVVAAAILWPLVDGLPAPAQDAAFGLLLATLALAVRLVAPLLGGRLRELTGGAALAALLALGLLLP